MRIVFWIAFSAMLAVYSAMLFWSLPKLSALSGGEIMFDLRPGGYSFAEARGVLQALGYEGRDFYQHVQHRLDGVFPALMAGVLVLAYQALFTRIWAMGFSVIALLAAGFDYLENASVGVMLAAGFEGVTPQMVEAASRWTQAKSLAVFIALCVLLFGLARSFWRRRHAP